MMIDSLAQASIIGHQRTRYVTRLKRSGFKSNPLNTDTPILRTLSMAPSVAVSSGCLFNPLSPNSDQHQISSCNIIVCKREWS